MCFSVTIEWVVTVHMRCGTWIYFSDGTDIGCGGLASSAVGP